MQTSRVSMALAATLLFGHAVFSSPVNAQTRYRVTEIRPNPQATYTFAAAINNRGEIVGIGEAQSFVYNNGSIIDLTPVLGSNADPVDINDAGVITGFYSRDSGGFLYSDGVATSIPPPSPPVKSSSFHLVDAINNSGEVTIQNIVLNPDGASFSYFASIYRNGEFVRLGSLGGTYTRAYGINDFGHAVGNSSLAGDRSGHAFLYRDGRMIDLGTLGQGNDSRATSINNAGKITGYSYIDRSALHAFLYRPDALTGDKMIDLGTLGGTYSYGRSINNADQVVGYSAIESGEEHAFIYAEADGVMWNLNKLIDRSDPLAGRIVLSGATDINDHGWIVAYGHDENDPDTIRAYLLRPVANDP